MGHPLDNSHELSDASRLSLIDEVLTAHDKQDWEFDRISRLAATCLNAPISLVSLVTSDKQLFAGACGLPGELADTRETPLSYSICQHAVLRRNFLVIPDATADPVFAEVLSVKEYGIRSYLGCPLMTATGEILGSFCVIDFETRQWTENDIDKIRDFASIVVDKIEAGLLRERSRTTMDVVIHDLKTPLSGISMASSLIGENLDQIPQKFQPMMEIISESSESALKLIGHLANDGKQEQLPVCPDVPELVVTIASRFQQPAERKSISLNLDHAGNFGAPVSKWVIEQVIENLLSNAVKYAPHGTRIEIATHRDDGFGHITITDEGPGFTETDRSRMFTRYTRLSASPTGNEPSAGLGLSIVKRLLDQHGGRIELTSGPGTGARFVVSFPAV